MSLVNRGRGGTGGGGGGTFSAEALVRGSSPYTHASLAALNAYGTETETIEGQQIRTLWQPPDIVDVHDDPLAEGGWWVAPQGGTPLAQFPGTMSAENGTIRVSKKVLDEMTPLDLTARAPVADSSNEGDISFGTVTGKAGISPGDYVLECTAAGAASTPETTVESTNLFSASYASSTTTTGNRASAWTFEGTNYLMFRDGSEGSVAAGDIDLTGDISPGDVVRLKLDDANYRDYTILTVSTSTWSDGADHTQTQCTWSTQNEVGSVPVGSAVTVHVVYTIPAFDGVKAEGAEWITREVKSFSQVSTTVTNNQVAFELNKSRLHLHGYVAAGTPREVSNSDITDGMWLRLKKNAGNYIDLRCTQDGVSGSSYSTRATIDNVVEVGTVAAGDSVSIHKLTVTEASPTTLKLVDPDGADVMTGITVPSSGGSSLSTTILDIASMVVGTALVVGDSWTIGVSAKTYTYDAANAIVGGRVRMWGGDTSWLIMGNHNSVSLPTLAAGDVIRLVKDGDAWRQGVVATGVLETFGTTAQGYRLLPGGTVEHGISDGDNVYFSRWSVKDATQGVPVPGDVIAGGAITAVWDGTDPPGAGEIGFNQSKGYIYSKTDISTGVAADDYVIVYLDENNYYWAQLSRSYQGSMPGDDETYHLLQTSDNESLVGNIPYGASVSLTKLAYGAGGAPAAIGDVVHVENDDSFHRAEISGIGDADGQWDFSTINESSSGTLNAVAKMYSATITVPPQENSPWVVASSAPGIGEVQVKASEVVINGWTRNSEFKTAGSLMGAIAWFEDNMEMSDPAYTATGWRFQSSGSATDWVEVDNVTNVTFDGASNVRILGSIKSGGSGLDDGAEVFPFVIATRVIPARQAWLNSYDGNPRAAAKVGSTIYVRRSSAWTKLEWKAIAAAAIVRSNL